MSSYILRKTDETLWLAVRARCKAEGYSVKSLIERLLRDWLTGRIP